MTKPPKFGKRLDNSKKKMPIKRKHKEKMPIRGGLIVRKRN